MTDELIAYIKAQERFVGHPYRDPVGKWTIGYGRLLDQETGPVHPNVTEAEAAAMLREDLEKYEAMALRLSPGLVIEPPRRLDAITDFCFNAGGKAYERSTLRQLVNQGQWSRAAASMRLWIYGTNPDGHKVILPGLVKRRAITSAWLEYPESALPPAA